MYKCCRVHQNRLDLREEDITVFNYIDKPDLTMTSVSLNKV